MRGEDGIKNIDGYSNFGSPPHARGRLESCHSHFDELGITPACAGKTAEGALVGAAREDHPRMRGEDAMEWVSDILGKGSPPHARGRPSRARSGDRLGGITPACAGKTPSGAHPRPPATDHPRMRGEDEEEVVGSSRNAGSPPHARGRLVRAKTKRTFRRITPACAGKTST